MGWGFRKSINLGGGFRLNLGKRGVGFSVGTRGFRVSSGPSGTYLNAGLYGIYFRQRLDASPRTGNRTPEPVASEVSMIETAHPSQLRDAGTQRMLSELNARHRKLSIRNMVAVAGVLLGTPCFLMGATSGHPGWWELLISVAVVTFVGCSVGHQKDLDRKTITMDFALEGNSGTAFKDWEDALAALASCGCVWHVNSMEGIDDWKRNSGASYAVTRHRVSFERRLPPYFRSNITPFAVTLGGQTLYFFPDRLLVYAGRTVGGVLYGSVRVGTGSTRFHEDGYVYRDSQVVGSTWRFVNRDGGPDRRFNNNREIPVCLYGTLAFVTDTGMNLQLETSNSQVPSLIASAIEQMRTINAYVESAATQLHTHAVAPAPAQETTDTAPSQVDVQCPACDRHYRVRSAHAGRQAKCECGHVFAIKGGAAA